MTQSIEDIVKLTNAATDDEVIVTGPTKIQYTIAKMPITSMMTMFGNLKVEGGNVEMTPGMGGEMLIKAIVSGVKYPKLIYKDDDLFFAASPETRVRTGDQDMLFNETVKIIKSLKMDKGMEEVVDSFRDEPNGGSNSDPGSGNEHPSP